MTADTTAGEVSAEAEEAAWELATAERLRAQGDLAGAASWYRRAAEHLMDAGEDDRALDVAKQAAELAALDRAAPVVAAPPAPAAPVVAAPPPASVPAPGGFVVP